MFSNIKTLSIDTTVILRRDAGAVQLVLSEGPAGFVVTGVDMASCTVVVVKPCDGLDDGIKKFRKEAGL